MKTSNPYLYILRNKSFSGFTLIEMLVVVVIISILTAIALPSFLSVVNRAKETEGDIYVSQIKEAQKDHYMQPENGNRFARTLDELDLGIKPNNYDYTISVKEVNGVDEEASVLATAKGQYRNIRGCLFVSKELQGETYKSTKPGEEPPSCSQP